MSRLYESFATSMDEIIGNIPVLDQLSVAGQNLLAAATQQLNSMPVAAAAATSSAAAAAAAAGGAGRARGAGGDTGVLNAAEAEAELRAFDSKEAEPFVKPICDIFLELFELNRDNNWLRGRAVVVILHQLLGGAIERKTRELARALAQDDAVLRCVDALREAVWPGGALRRTPRVRTAPERAQSRAEASAVLATLVPDVAGSVVGRANAQAASRKIVASLNNPFLTYVLSFLSHHSFSFFLSFPSLFPFPFHSTI
jgi:sorting nexin-25